MSREGMRLALAALAVAACIASPLLVAADRDTRLADAAQRGDRQAVRTLLTQAADVDAAQGDGMTALHWASLNDDHEMARALVAAGANVKAITRLGDNTPLLMAAQNGNAELVAVLLKAGADPNAATTLGVTPMMQAAAAGSPETIEVLAAAGANPNARENTYGQTPLIFAAAMNQPTAIDALVNVGADVSIGTTVRTPAARGGGGGGGRGGRGGRGGAPAGRGPTQEAAATTDAGAPRGRGARGAAPNESARGRGPGPGPAQEIADDGQPEDQDLAPPRAVSEPSGGLTPLHYAARQGHSASVRALLGRGANIDSGTGDNTTPLMIAIINGRFDLAMELLERGADPKIATAAGGTPLYRVVDLQWAPKSFYPQPDIRQERVSYLDLMRALIARGADPNARLAKQLWYTTYGFDLDALDPTGATPFWRAAQAGDLDAMRLLVAHGADPNLGTRENVTPLLALAGDGFHGNDAIVVPQGRMPAVRYLVEEIGADVNALDERGGAATSILHQNTRAYTAVHAAAARGDNEMIRYLVSKGARVDLVGKNGLTVADMANGPRERIQPFPETIALLIELGSKFSNNCRSC